MALLTTAALTLSLSVTFTLTSANQAAACLTTSKLPGKWNSSDGRLSHINVIVSESCGLSIRAYSRCDYDATKNCPWDGGRAKKLSPSRYVAGAQYAKYSWNNASEQLRLVRDSDYLSVQDYIEWKSGKTESFTVRMHR
ncbi:hypothetical protein ACFVW1_09650 [Streptomyces olivochromogenes]|uniref:hypothetical protein n=1 Tax=Streptomyces olivochromogenes TaxID=1963 RepID=UPI0036DBF17F